MSGGRYDYVQFRLNEVGNDIRKELQEKLDNYCDNDEQREQVEKRCLIAAAIVDACEEALQRVDWFFCGDDGADSFLSRWDEKVAGPVEALFEILNTDDRNG